MSIFNILPILENILNNLYSIDDVKNFTIINKNVYHAIKNCKMLYDIKISKMNYHFYCRDNILQFLKLKNLAMTIEIQKSIIIQMMDFLVINKNFVDTYPNFKITVQKKIKELIIYNDVVELKTQYIKLFGNSVESDLHCKYVPKTGKNKNKMCCKSHLNLGNYCNIHKRYLKN